MPAEYEFGSWIQRVRGDSPEMNMISSGIVWERQSRLIVFGGRGGGEFLFFCFLDVAAFEGSCEIKKSAVMFFSFSFFAFLGF